MASSLFQKALKVRGTEIPISRGFTQRGCPLIMGVLNLNSFCRDGFTNFTLALERARKMAAEGADIIDVEAESTSPNRRVRMSEEEEIQRLLPFVKNFDCVMADTESPPLLSLNTWRPAVARTVLDVGGHILNDLSALPENASLCAEHGVALVITHSVGEPKVPYPHVRYENAFNSLCNFFEKKICLAEAAGMPREDIILDPGIDFAKQEEKNHLAIYRELEALHSLCLPILLPVSRKDVICNLNIPNPQECEAGAMACIVAAMLRGVGIFRVQNVKAAAYAVRVLHNVLLVKSA